MQLDRPKKAGFIYLGMAIFSIITLWDVYQQLNNIPIHFGLISVGLPCVLVTFAVICLMPTERKTLNNEATE